ncbi:MAG: hypothetical protein JO322_03940 [Candidatus Eremiobacteraeota bacterium]|nr:hypothetical protein [Candidatus Eremiobacteraeota bacterium]
MVVIGPRDVRIKSKRLAALLLLIGLAACSSGANSTLPSNVNNSNASGVAYPNGGTAALPEFNNVGHLTEFDVPDASKVVIPACAPPGAPTSSCGTVVTSIDDEGTIVGWFTDRAYLPHAFIRNAGGAVRSFDAPGAGTGKFQGTYANAINNRGVIAGYLQESSNRLRGFLRGPSGSFTLFDAPGAGTGMVQGTAAIDVNINGVADGQVIDSKGVSHSFIRLANGAMRTFDPPGSVYSAPTPDGSINMWGAIVGYYGGTDNLVHAFLRTQYGLITKIDPPGAAGGAIAASISDSNVVSGYYVDSKGVLRGFLRFPNGSYLRYNAPNGSQVSGEGVVAGPINIFSTVGGTGFDAKGFAHGFSRRIDGAFATFDAPGGGGTTFYKGTVSIWINNSGTIAGIWNDDKNLSHGFVWQPPQPTAFAKPAAQSQVLDISAKSNPPAGFRSLPYPPGTIERFLPKRP